SYRVLNGQTSIDTTESVFDIENTFKLEYNGSEDEIIKKIQEGNVSIPLSRDAEGRILKKNNSLIKTPEFNEKPLTQKVNVGDDQIVNIQYGIDKDVSQVDSLAKTIEDEILQKIEPDMMERPITQKVNISDEPITDYLISPLLHFDSTLIDSILKISKPVDTIEKCTPHLLFGNMRTTPFVGQLRSKETESTQKTSNEKPLTQKVNISDEPFNNTVIGIVEESDSTYLEIPLIQFSSPFLFIGSSLSEDVLRERTEKETSCLKFLFSFFLN
ncbi:MAG: hypothetical protein IAF38_20485, partial [Bacteroidia bacterium]|nr:hypothetical protein [Bacteroidia bacterium]